MIRVLRNSLAVLSLVVFLAAALSWGWSYRAAVQPFDEFPGGTLAVEHWRGAVRLVVPLGRGEVAGGEIIPFPRKNLGPGDSSSWQLGGVATGPTPGGKRFRVRDIRLDETPTHRRFQAAAFDEQTVGTSVAGTRWQTGRRPVGPVDTDATPVATMRRWGAVVVPHAYVVALSGGYPVWRAVRMLRNRRRNRAGLCRVCGYDLRATPGRCPECGAEPEVQASGLVSAKAE